MTVETRSESTVKEFIFDAAFGLAAFVLGKEFIKSEKTVIADKLGVVYPNAEAAVTQCQRLTRYNAALSTPVIETRVYRRLVSKAA